MSGTMTINIVTKLRNFGDATDSSQQFAVSGIQSEIRKKDVIGTAASAKLSLNNLASTYGFYVRNISATSTAKTLFVTLSNAATSVTEHFRINEGEAGTMGLQPALSTIVLTNYSTKGKIAYEIIVFGS